MISAARIFSVIDSDVVRIQIQYQLFMDAGQMGVPDAGGVKHLLRGDGAVRVRIFVREINDLFDAGLDNSFCTFIAGEQSNIYFAAV